MNTPRALPRRTYHGWYVLQINLGLWRIFILENLDDFHVYMIPFLFFLFGIRIACSFQILLVIVNRLI